MDNKDSKRAAIARNNLEPGGHGLIGDRFGDVTKSLCVGTGWAHSWNSTHNSSSETPHWQ
jgi:hypothetical protein